MSLRLHRGSRIPAETAQVARAALPQGNPYLTPRDALDTIYAESIFEDFLAKRGQPAASPGRLALVAGLQVAENLSDRQAAGAVRNRIDWQYLLGLDLGESGFDFSILSAFRARLLAGGHAQRLLDDLLECFRARGLVQALRFDHAGRLVICADETTGRQILQRRSPTRPVQPGKPEKRQHESIRHGVCALLASCVVPTGHLVWHLGQTDTSADWAAHLANVVRQLPAMQRYAWMVDNPMTHWSLNVGRLVAAWCDLPCVPKALARGVQRRAFLREPAHTHVSHCTPTQGSWWKQVKLWLSVLARRFLKRSDDDSVQDFEARLSDYLEVYNTHHAHPYRWLYTGQPLVRATSLRQTCRQQRQGRAWLGPRPIPFARACSPPRPSTRFPASLVANL